MNKNKPTGNNQREEIGGLVGTDPNPLRIKRCLKTDCNSRAKLDSLGYCWCFRHWYWQWRWGGGPEGPLAFFRSLRWSRFLWKNLIINERPNSTINDV